MTYTNHVRINELARELEVKSKVIIRLLPCFGVTEKKSRSSSIPLDIAEKIRAAKSLFHNSAGTSVLSATAPEHVAPPAPTPVTSKPAPALGVIENLEGVRGSSERQPDLPTYEELLARLYRLEAERNAPTRFKVSAIGRNQRRNRKRKRKKKRKANPKSERYRTVSGGLPSLGKRR
jgi:hypothetical protein